MKRRTTTGFSPSPATFQDETLWSASRVVRIASTVLGSPKAGIVRLQFFKNKVFLSEQNFVTSERERERETERGRAREREREKERERERWAGEIERGGGGGADYFTHT